MWLHLRRARGLPAHIPTPNLGPPADLGLALKFGLFLAAFSLAAWYAGAHLGDAGVIAASAVSGLIDVDAVTVTLARQGPADVAARGILAAVAVNIVVKAVYAVAIAGPILLRPMVQTVAAGLIGLILGGVWLVP